MKMHRFAGASRVIAVLAALFALAGCSSTEFVNPVPKDYDGPTAKISDSYSHNSGESAYFFVLNAVDGLAVEDSGHRTKEAMSGRTLRMQPRMAARWVKAEEQTFTISGFVQYANPAKGMFGADDMRVSGNVTFKPKPNGRYMVKGKLAEGASTVWIEDMEGRLIGEVVKFTAEETASR